MKRGTPKHPKTWALCQRLGMPRYAAVGLLECLWHLAAEHAPTGELSKTPPAWLAAELEWDRDADELISALVETGWLDRDGDRLLIHDWPDHCEDMTHMRLARARKFFADGRAPNYSRIGGKERKQIEAFYSGKSTDPEGGSTPCARRVHAVATAEADALAEAEAEAKALAIAETEAEARTHGDDAGVAPPIGSDSSVRGGSGSMSTKARAGGMQRWLLTAERLAGWIDGKRDPRQKKTDVRCLRRMFHDTIWPDDLHDEDGKRRLAEACELVGEAGDADRPMAYLTRCVQNLEADHA